MLHSILADYLNAVEQSVSCLINVYVEHYVEEILTATRANLRIRIRFTKGYLLELNETVTVDADKLVALDYRYHCQNGQNILLFRYDNAPHFPDLATFPHHKHLPNGTVACVKPSIFAVFKECETLG